MGLSSLAVMGNSLTLQLQGNTSRRTQQSATLTEMHHGHTSAQQHPRLASGHAAGGIDRQ